MLAVTIDATGEGVHLGETVADYERLGAPWKHMEFIAGGGKLGFGAATMAVCVPGISGLRVTRGGRKGVTEGIAANVLL